MASDADDRPAVAWRSLVAMGNAAPAWFAADNGFPSADRMAAAHAPLIAAVADHAAPGGATVVDLGCGNGALLAACCDRVPSLRPVGVERCGIRLARAALMCPHADACWVHGDMFDALDIWSQQPPGIVLLMLGRLLETHSAAAATLRSRLRVRGDIVLGYAYDDWLARYGDLDALCAATGVTPQTTPAPSRMVVALAL